MVLLAEEFWRGRFGGDPEILGTTLTLNEQALTVVGVLPSGGPWLSSAEVFAPMIRDPEAARASFELVAIGTTDDWVADRDLRRALWILLAAVGFLLLIACVNLANLLLAKATGRGRETAIRAAVGAGRSRLLRQALTESVLLSLMGAVLGILLATWGLAIIRTLDPGGIPRLNEVSLNHWVLLFTLGVAVITGVVTGVAPAFQSSGADAAETLKAGSRSVAGGRRQQKMRSVLVAAEMALSLTLLVGAGLLIRSFTELMGVERGFQTENRLMASVSLPPSYGSIETENLLRQLTNQAQSHPQINRITAVSARPVTDGSTGMGITTPENPDPEGSPPWAEWRMVTPSYLEALGIPLIRGRFFDEISN